MPLLTTIAAKVSKRKRRLIFFFDSNFFCNLFWFIPLRLSRSCLFLVILELRFAIEESEQKIPMLCIIVSLLTLNFIGTKSSGIETEILRREIIRFSVLLLDEHKAHERVFAQHCISIDFFKHFGSWTLTWPIILFYFRILLHLIIMCVAWHRSKWTEEEFPHEKKA